MRKQEQHIPFFTVVPDETFFVVKYIHPKSGNDSTFGIFRDQDDALKRFRSANGDKAHYLEPLEYDQMISKKRRKAEPQIVQLSFWSE